MISAIKSYDKRSLASTEKKVFGDQLKLFKNS
jgi:hypothetical protein